ncbi:PREDICTED: laminin subunit alpha-2-like [Priapulus caudatus]|uniref:Laminin subunit alpha-2-like n=1 Tax=Priapulus caudatus TaxID=37621 RepID=A0ABM1EUK2_PRICU|nr:PREDICTED: laminin subunit alpha-2-like [Priapulus caudatus]
MFQDSNRLMKDSSSRIEAMNSGGLFLGGVPEGFRVENMAATDKPFEGCISDIIHNKVLISLDKPTSFNSVELGRCSLPHKLPPTIPPPPPISFPPWQLPRLLDTSTVATVYETTDATDMTEEADGVSQEMFSNEATTEMPESVDSCTPPGRYEKEEHAVKFGDQQHSFSIIHVVKRDIQQNFIMRFHFRTYEPNGMLVYIGNHGDTQHVAGQLAEGRFVLSLNYNNVQELKSGTGGLNDGQWHNVTIHKRKSKLKMSVDERGEQASKVKRKLNVKPMIYVGGLPANITNTVGVVKQGFQGCVKNFRFNSDPINLAGVNTTSQGVTHCYTNVETGAYFAGDAYAIYEAAFKTAWPSMT